MKGECHPDGIQPEQSFAHMAQAMEINQPRPSLVSPGYAGLQWGLPTQSWGTAGVEAESGSGTETNSSL